MSRLVKNKNLWYYIIDKHEETEHLKHYYTKNDF